MTSDNSGTAYQSPNIELMLESEQVYKTFCQAIEKNSGLKGKALEQKLTECNKATYRLLFGTEHKRELNSMEQVYLNWHLSLIVAIIETK